MRRRPARRPTNRHSTIRRHVVTLRDPASIGAVRNAMNIPWQGYMGPPPVNGTVCRVCVVGSLDCLFAVFRDGVLHLSGKNGEPL